MSGNRWDNALLRKALLHAFDPGGAETALTIDANGALSVVLAGGSVKQVLSGSVDGQPIKVSAVATAGTLIHTAGATGLDEITIYAVNTANSNRSLTIEFGGVAAPDDQIVVDVRRNAGALLVVPGVPLANGKVVRAFASVADDINIIGWVDRTA